MTMYAGRGGHDVKSCEARDDDSCTCGPADRCDDAGERVPEGEGGLFPDKLDSLPPAYASYHNSAHGQHREVEDPGVEDRNLRYAPELPDLPRCPCAEFFLHEYILMFS